MKKGKIKALLVLLVIVLAGIYYYVTIGDQHSFYGNLDFYPVGTRIDSGSLCS